MLQKQEARGSVWYVMLTEAVVNSSPPGQNGSLFADDIFRCISVNEKFCILGVKISLKFVPRGPIDNNQAQALAQIMAWCRIGDKPLPEPMLTWFTDAYMRHWSVCVCVCVCGCVGGGVGGGGWGWGVGGGGWGWVGWGVGGGRGVNTEYRTDLV